MPSRYLFSYPIYLYERPISYRIWLPRWNQILTQLRVHPQLSNNGHPVDGALDWTWIGFIAPMFFYTGSGSLGSRLIFLFQILFILRILISSRIKSEINYKSELSHLFFWLKFSPKCKGNKNIWSQYFPFFLRIFAIYLFLIFFFLGPHLDSGYDLVAIFINLKHVPESHWGSH